MDMMPDLEFNLRYQHELITLFTIHAEGVRNYSIEKGQNSWKFIIGQ